MLSRESETILKMLYKKEEKFRKLSDDEKEYSKAKVSYSEIKDKLQSKSHISVVMILKYLLEEKYIYNHIDGKENEFDIEDLKKDKLKLVIGEKGISYLEYKKYVIISKVLPISISIMSLGVSIYSIF